MRSRLILVLIALLLLLPQASPTRSDDDGGATSDNSANSDNGSAIQIDLQTMLEKGLRARRPEEFEYLAQIAEMVVNGELPESMVRSTFGWARRKRPYPFQYFQRALQLRAAKIGIELPTV